MVVMIFPLISSMLISSGIAVISLDFSSVLIRPMTRLHCWERTNDMNRSPAATLVRRVPDKLFPSITMTSLSSEEWQITHQVNKALVKFLQDWYRIQLWQWYHWTEYHFQNHHIASKNRDVFPNPISSQPSAPEITAQIVNSEYPIIYVPLSGFVCNRDNRNMFHQFLSFLFCSP